MNRYDYRSGYRSGYRRMYRSGKADRARTNRAILAWASLGFLILVVALMYAAVKQSSSSSNTKQITGAKPATKAEKESAPATDAVAEGHKIRVKANVLNMRSSAEIKNDNIVRQLVRGEELRVISRKGDWYEVETAKGRRGYVTADERYVEVAK